MNIQDKLFAKSGQATVSIAFEFLELEVGDRVKTVTELEEKYAYSRGTIQNALNVLKNYNVIKTVSRGHQGTFLEAKDDSLLLQLIGITSIVGCMPLPYSRRYEGLASGLIASIEENTNIDSTIVFSRGADARAEMVLKNRCDYAIMSKLAATKIIKKNKDLKIIKEFGINSYLSDHVIVFHDKKVNEIKDGMRIGVDSESTDQKELVELVCKNKNVDFVKIAYPNLLKKVMAGDIDATVWNKDEIYEKFLDISYKTIENKKDDDTIAVMVINSKKKELESLLNKYIDVKYIKNKAKLVFEGLETPRY